jgi:hypothetical protein
MWQVWRANSSCHPSLHTVSRDFQICLCSSVSQIPVEPTLATTRWLSGYYWHGRNLANDALCIQLPPHPITWSVTKWVKTCFF